MNNKVLKLLDRLNSVEEELGRPDVFNDQQLYRTLTQEHSYLQEVKTTWEEISRLEKQLADNKELLSAEGETDFAVALREDSAHLDKRVHELKVKLENLLVPPDPSDNGNTILEIRAGTGGDEAALFVGDCVRMYKMYADKMGWKCEPLSCTESERGGFKEYVMVLSGANVYRLLRHEGGTHRVQRVPDTEAQGRVHTSAITVAALLEPGEESEIEIDEKDLRIDTFRASGAGGQHVNRTDSAVRITHMPSGIVVGCQEDRSQHKNRDKAMRVLKAKLAEAEKEKRHQEMASNRAIQVGSGDRSERIRTYNFPQNRVTDHRIDLTLYNLNLVMDGLLEEITSALVTHFHQLKLEQS